MGRRRLVGPTSSPLEERPVGAVAPGTSIRAVRAALQLLLAFHLVLGPMGLFGEELLWNWGEEHQSTGLVGMARAGVASNGRPMSVFENPAAIGSLARSLAVQVDSGVAAAVARPFAGWDSSDTDSSDYGYHTTCLPAGRPASLSARLFLERTHGSSGRGTGAGAWVARGSAKTRRADQ